MNKCYLVSGIYQIKIGKKETIESQKMFKTYKEAKKYYDYVLQHHLKTVNIKFIEIKYYDDGIIKTLDYFCIRDKGQSL